MVQRSSRILCGLALALGLLLGYGTPVHGQGTEFDEEALKRDVLVKVPDGGADLSVEELIRDIGKRMGMIPAIAESVKGKKIRFYTNAELNFYTIVEVLRTHDIELIVKEAGSKRLLEAVLNREVQAKTGANPGQFIRPGEALPGDQEIVTAVYYFEHIDQTAIQQAQTAVRALMTRDPRRAGHIIQVPGTNAIIITDFSSSVDFYLSIARAIDQPVPQLDYKIVQVNFALADELAVLVNNLTPALDLEAGGAGSPTAPAAGRRVQRNAAPGASASPGQPQVVADARTNKLVILALPADIAKIERLIRELDVEVKPAPRNFHVYKVINANALDLADQLNLLFGGTDSGFSASRSSTSARDRTSRTTPRTTLSNRNARNNTRTQTQPRTTTPRSLGGSSLGGGRNANNPGQELIETRIVPDETTNSLLIQAAPEDYRDILSILQELDKKRKRVIVEAEIWEIEHTDDLFFGVDMAFTDGASGGTNNPNPIRGHGGSFTGLLSPVISDDGDELGLSPNIDTFGRGGLITLLTHGTFDRVPVILQTLRTVSKANLITRPFAVTNDGETALFEVTQQEPFQVSNSTTAAAFQGFDFAEARSALEITPRIASESNLTLDLALDISSFTAAAQGDAPPPSSGRSYQGTVTIPNRQYAIFGGFELDSATEAKSRVPLLGDIPVLGWLFGRTTTRSVRRRIYVFIRPVILDAEDFAGDRNAAAFAREKIMSDSILGRGLMPIIPDEVMDAEAPGTKAAVWAAFGDAGLTAFPESESVLDDRRAANKRR